MPQTRASRSQEVRARIAEGQRRRWAARKAITVPLGFLDRLQNELAELKARPRLTIDDALTVARIASDVAQLAAATAAAVQRRAGVPAPAGPHPRSAPRRTIDDAALKRAERLAAMTVLDGTPPRLTGTLGEL